MALENLFWFWFFQGMSKDCLSVIGHLLALGIAGYHKHTATLFGKILGLLARAEEL